ncbi:MAG: hypothetical protein R6X14_08920 [bacterium]
MLVSRLWLTLLAVALLAGPSPAAGGQWHYLSGGAFNGISSVGDRVWVVGQDGLSLQSYDNGASWYRVPRFSARNLLDVEFRHPALGIVIAEGDVVYRTENAGASWDSVPVPGSAGRVRFLTDRVVFITGSDRLLWSTNAGAAWEDRGALLGPVWFTDTAHGWRGDAYGWVEHSSDGGTSWTQRGRIPDYSVYYRMNTLGFADSLHGVCNYYGWSGSPRVPGYNRWARTSDGGVNWQLDAYGSGFGCDVSGGLVYGLERGGVRVFEDTGSRYEPLLPPTRATGVAARAGARVWVCAAGGIVWGSADSGRSWTVARGGTTSDLTEVQFVDSLSGWAVGPQALLRTSDGGRNWQADSAVAGKPDRRCRGIAVTDKAIFISEDSLWWWADPVPEYWGWRRIRRSSNGGLNWITIDSIETWTRSPYWQASRLFFLDSLHGWHPGDHASGNPVRTTDGGESWLQMSAVVGPVGELSFTSPDSGWLTDGRGIIMATTDGGNTWLEQYSASQVRGIHMNDSRSGWAAGVAGLLRTEDGGGTWQLMPVAESLEAVHFAGPQHGVAVGRHGRIVRTTDGGETWVADSSEFGSRLTAVFVLDSARMWAVGEGGLVMGFGDWALRQDEPRWGGRVPPLARLTVRPNPCRGYVVLETAPASGLELELRDVAGRRVRQLALPAGSRGAAVDLRGLPAGVYFVTQPRAAGEAPVRLVKVE